MSEDTKTRAALYKKIAAVTAAVQRIPKNGENKFHGYKYALESDITDGLRELLNEHGLAFLPPIVLEWERTATQSKAGDLTRVKYQFGLADCETGETFESIWISEAQDNADKAFNKAATAAAKYWLMKTFLIATGDDPDADQHDDKTQAPAKTPARGKGPITPDDLPFDKRTPWEQARDEVQGAQNNKALAELFNKHEGKWSPEEWDALQAVFSERKATLNPQKAQVPA